MEPVNQKSNLLTIAIIILVALTLCGLSIFFISFVSTYVLEGFFATIVLAVAVGLPIYQKRITFYSLLLLAVGLLFISGALISFGYENVVEPLPILAQIEFSKVLRPQQVSRGIMNIGFGVIYIILFLQSRTIQAFVAKHKWVVYFLFAIGIAYLLLGIDSAVEGFRKL